jgi:hypothetical protein
MSARINQYQREEIRRLVIKHKYGKTEEALANRSDTVARQVYEKIYSASERDWISARPSSFKVANEFYIKSGNGSSGYRAAKANQNLPVFADRMTTIVVDPGDAIDTEAFAIQQEKKDLETNKKADIKELDAQLAKFYTFDKLVKEWPEIATFVEQVRPTTPNVPAVDFRSLNERFELPPEQPAS